MDKPCDTCYYGGSEKCDATHSFDVYGKPTKGITTCGYYENTRQKEDSLLVSELHWKLKRLNKTDRYSLYTTIKELL